VSSTEEKCKHIVGCISTNTCILAIAVGFYVNNYIYWTTYSVWGSGCSPLGVVCWCMTLAPLMVPEKNTGRFTWYLPDK